MLSTIDTGRQEGAAKTIISALKRSGLTEGEKQIIANRVVTMTDDEFEILLNGERAILDFFGLRPEFPKPNGTNKNGKK